MFDHYHEMRFQIDEQRERLKVRIDDIALAMIDKIKKYEEIISNIPTFNCFIYHYGNGDEDDQFGLENFFKEKCKIHIFPGISYGFIQFENI